MNVDESGEDVGRTNMEPSENIKNNEREFSHSLLS
jgi:hypothetical protein